MTTEGRGIRTRLDRHHPGVSRGSSGAMAAPTSRPLETAVIPFICPTCGSVDIDIDFGSSDCTSCVGGGKDAAA
ncbi:hypothetical protein ACXYX3_13430 [Mycobacterium sp. C3-094]